MPAASTSRITIEPGKRRDVLGWLGAGMTEEQILAEHPDLEKADFQAVYQFAANAGRRAHLV